MEEVTHTKYKIKEQEDLSDFEIDSKGNLAEKRTVYVEEEPILSALEFSRRGFISAESWDTTINLHSRILMYSKDVVTCECVIERETKTFQIRSFAAHLFSHLIPLKAKKLVQIKIQSKAGSSRIDIYDGNGIVDSDLFDVKDQWDQLKDSDLGKPLEL